MRAGGVNDICKAEAGPRGGPRYWEREEPKRPRPPGRRMQRTPHSQPNPQSQRRTPGSGWEAGCPDFACLLGREQPGPVRMERGKQMKSYIDRGQGAHHRSLGGAEEGPQDGPGQGTGPGHLPGAAGQGPPGPREMRSFIGALRWLSSAARPRPAAHLGAPPCPAPQPIQGPYALSRLTPHLWTPPVSAGHSALAGAGLIDQGSTGRGAGGGWQGPRVSLGKPPGQSLCVQTRCHHGAFGGGSSSHERSLSARM